MIKKASLFIFIFLTVILNSFAQNRFSHPPISIGHHIKTGDKIIFHIQSSRGNNKLFVTDGTSAGTIELGTFNILRYPYVYYDYPSIGVMNGEYYFAAAKNGGDQVEVWKTDGTAGGTVQAVDIDPDMGADPWSFKAFNGKIFFLTYTSFGQTYKKTSSLFSLDSQGNLESYPYTVSNSNYDQIQHFEIWNNHIYVYTPDNDALSQLDINTGSYTSIASLSVEFMQPTAEGLLIIRITQWCQ